MHKPPLKPAAGALDLFITSTDLYGRILSGKDLMFDYLQQPIETREYRRVFHLKFLTRGYNPSDQDLGYDKNDFLPAGNERLLRVARATSAFPVALRPVTLKREDEGLEDLLVPGDKVVYLTDGGVLNNKPFTDTIAAISRRGAFGKVDRILFFVEPDPETFLRNSSSKLAEPAFWDIIAKTSFGITSYQSIARDIMNIKDRNERIQRFKEILDGADKLIQNARDSHGELVITLDEKNYRNYIEAQPLFNGYQNLKVLQLRNRMRDQHLANSLSLDNLDSEVSLKVKGAFDIALDEFINQKGLKNFLEAFDAPYRVRRLFRLIEVTELIYQRENLTESDHKTIGKYLERLWALLDKVNMIEWRTWDSSDLKTPGWFRGQLEKLKQDAVALDSEHLKNEIASLLESMLLPADRGFGGLSEEYHKVVAEGKGLAQEIDNFVKELSSRSNQTETTFSSFSQIYNQFEFRDMFIYPIEVLADLGERDSVEIIRISPKDATYISSDAKSKLAGDTLFHFGGFLERRWRENDIMWGRLDAAELITRMLCKKADCTQAEQNKLIESVCREVLNEELPQAVTSSKGYKRYLQEDYKVGEESLGDIDAGRRATLGLNALLSLRDMLKYDQQSGGRANKTLQLVDKVLLRFLNYLCLPLTLLVQALFAKDSLVQAVFSFIILGLGTWGAITLILFLLGKLLSISWLNIGLPVAGIALAAIIFALLFGVLLTKVRRNKKTDKQKP